MSVKLKLLWLGLAALSCVNPVAAHHSRAIYDLSRYIEIKGTVTEWKWVAPHSQLMLAVADANGNVQSWVLECASPAFLMKYNWKRTDLKPGDKVTAIIRPMRSGAVGGSLSQAILADGRVLGGPDAPPPGYKSGEKSQQKAKRAEDADDDI